MENILLAFIYGPIEIIIPVLLVLMAIITIISIFAIIMVKIEEKNTLKKGMVIYPENLFEEIQEMKTENALRLYSKRIEKNLFVITSNQITEEYKDGKFISYASEKPVVLNATKTSLKEFIKNLPEINYKSMIVRIGFQKRIDYKQ